MGYVCFDKSQTAKQLAVQGASQDPVDVYSSSSDFESSFTESEASESDEERGDFLDDQEPLPQVHDKTEVRCDEVSHQPKGFYDLPVEVKTMIIEYLDTESTIASRVYDDPHRIVDKEGKMTGNEVTYDLKNASCVSKEWRSICFPLLFRFLSYKPQVDHGDPYARPPVYDIEEFLATPKTVTVSKPLLQIVKGLTVVVVKVPLRKWHQQVQEEVVALRYRDGLSYPSYVEQQKDGRCIWSYPDWIKEFWGSVFCQLDPLRVTLLGRPWDSAFMLGSLTSTCFYDAARRTVFHVERPQPQQWPLFRTEENFTMANMRRWTHILVNDGHSESCPNCTLLMSNLFWEGRPDIDRFTYINHNPFAITPDVLNQLLPAPSVDLILGPPATMSPLRLGKMNDDALLGTKSRWLASHNADKVVLRGQLYGILSRMLVARKISDFSVLNVSKFRLRSGANDGGKVWREFVQMVMWEQKRDEWATSWMEDGEGWLVKLNDTMGF